MQEHDERGEDREKNSRIRTFAAKVRKADQGLGELVEAVSALGLTVWNADVAGMKPVQLLAGALLTGQM